MGQARRPTCPDCGAYLTLALPPGGEGPRTFQCLHCEGPGPLKGPYAAGWLAGELGRTKSPEPGEGLPTCVPGNASGPSFHLQISRRFLTAIADDIIADLGALIEATQAGLFDG